MAHPILGVPKPQLFDSNGDPLASGTVSILEPSDDSNKLYYDNADDADGVTNFNTGDITLDSAGRPTNQIWGESREDYKVVLKDSSGTTIWTIADYELPQKINAFQKVKTADTSRNQDPGSFTSDPHLTGMYVYPRSSYYKLTGYLLATAAAATQDIKFIVSVTNADSSLHYISVDAGNAGAVDQGEVLNPISATGVTVDIDGTDNVGIYITGFFLTASSGSRSNVILSWTQGTQAGSTTLKQGSWLKIERVVT